MFYHSVLLLVMRPCGTISLYDGIPVQRTITIAFYTGFCDKNMYHFATP